MTDALSSFFAILTMCSFAAVLVVAVVAALYRTRPSDTVVSLFLGIRSLSLWLGWLVAAVTMLGSLYYSLIADYIPCELCWYQRICIYPFAVILLIAAVRNDWGIWKYGVLINLIGIAISIYHTQLQAFPKQQTFCSELVPCTSRYVYEWGFVSLPLMALAAQLVIVSMLLLARSVERDAAATPDTSEVPS